MERLRAQIPRPNERDYIFAEESPEWLNTPSPFDALDDIWQELIVFYVFHVPVSDMSVRSRTLESYGWGRKSKNDDFKQLKNRLIRYGNMTEETFQCEEGWREFRQSCERNDLIDFPQDIRRERVSFRKTKSGINDSLLSHIRNSFAHGRLAFYSEDNSTYVAMEDMDDKRHVSARMILSKETLLRWKFVIESGPCVKCDALERAMQWETNDNG